MSNVRSFIVLAVTTWAFIVCFAVWLMFGVIGIPIRDELGLNGAEIVLIPSATSRGLSEYLWRVEQVSHALANGYFVGTINRVGIEKDLGDDDFYGQSYFVDPRGQFIGDVGSPHDEELLVRDMDLDMIDTVRQTWQFYRDRRPDAYGDLVRP